MGFLTPEKVMHGSITGLPAGSSGDDVIDFSVNLNPFPPEVEWSPQDCDIDCYPDDRYSVLKEKIARVIGINPEEICVGNGSVEIIRSFSYGVISPGMRVRIDPPTFGEYSHSARMAGGEIVSGEDAHVRFLCNPNNPSGRLLPKEEVLRMAEDQKNRGGLLFVDEAFIELSDPGQSVVSEKNSSLFILRSLTKTFSVPGVRFGFGVGDPVLIEQLETIRPPWTVNTYAEMFAYAAMDHIGELEGSRQKIESERKWLEDRFDAMGISYLKSKVNFVMLNPGFHATEITARLLKKGIYVRDCSSFGLPQSFRVAVRTHEDNILLVEALSECLP